MEALVGPFSVVWVRFFPSVVAIYRLAEIVRNARRSVCSLISNLRTRLFSKTAHVDEGYEHLCSQNIMRAVQLPAQLILESRQEAAEHNASPELRREKERQTKHRRKEGSKRAARRAATKRLLFQMSLTQRKPASIQPKTNCLHKLGKLTYICPFPKVWPSTMHESSRNVPL